MNGLQTEELTQLREEMEELRKEHTLLQSQLSDKDALINTLVSKCLCTASTRLFLFVPGLITGRIM